MEYKVGDRVRIKSFDWYNENKNEFGDILLTGSTNSGYNFVEEMSGWCGRTMTILKVYKTSYLMEEDSLSQFFWTDEMIEGLVEDGNNMSDIDKLKKISTPAEENWVEIAEEWERKDKGMDNLKHEVILPEGYIFKDENGNVINAQKIVLEKKENEYPKTFKECCEIVNCVEHYKLALCFYTEKIDALYKLLICRDAYWKIAGEKMGLCKSWEPDWGNTNQAKYCIYTDSNNIKKAVWFFTNSILAFPTEEMRAAFYENFKELIEQCKELI